MSTTAPQPYRHHTQLPEWVHPAPSDKPGAKPHYLGVDEIAFRGTRRTSSAALALAAEWPLTNTAHRDEVRGWTQTEPALRGLGSGGGILDAIDTAPAAGKDELLLALLRLSQSGERFATRTLLQAVMPKLSQLAHYAHTDGDIEGSDRSSITTVAFLAVVQHYPVNRRLRGVAGNLALDTLHRITVDQHRSTAPNHVLHYEPWELEAAAAGDIAKHRTLTTQTPSVDPTDEVHQLLTWALEHQVITPDDSALLQRSFCFPSTDMPNRGHSATAAELGLSPAAVRQRCSRAIRCIRTAVQEQLGSDDLLDACTVAA